MQSLLLPKCHFERLNAVMPVRPSQVMRLVHENQPAHGVAVRLMDTIVPEFVSMIGFDAIWLDLEHHHLSVEKAAEMIRAARAGGPADVVARPGKGEFTRMARLLEAGAKGIMYPRCESAAEAAEVVRWAKFPPLGERGLDGAAADNPYRLTPVADYLRQANQETFLIAQIESPGALDQAAAIAAVPGIDFLMLGPGDFSASIGAPGQMNHPGVVAAHERVRAAAHGAGKHWAVTCFDMAHAGECLSKGARLLFHGSDWRLVNNGLQQLVQQARGLGAGG